MSQDEACSVSILREGGRSFLFGCNSVIAVAEIPASTCPFPKRQRLTTVCWETAAKRRAGLQRIASEAKRELLLRLLFSDSAESDAPLRRPSGHSDVWWEIWTGNVSEGQNWS